MDARLREAQSLAAIAGVEAHGPGSDLAKLRELLMLMGCRFFSMEPGCRLFGAREPSVWGFGTADTACTLLSRYVVKGGSGGDLSTLREKLRLIGESMKPEVEGLLSHGFAVDEASGMVLGRESYNDAAGILVHLRHTDCALRALLEVAELASMEVHGPASELAKLRSTLQPLGCRFYVLDTGSRSWLSPQEVLLLRQAQGSLQKDLMQRRLADRLRRVAGEEGLSVTKPTFTVAGGSTGTRIKAIPLAAGSPAASALARVAAVSGRGSGARSSPQLGLAPEAEDPTMAVQGVLYPLSKIRRDEALQDTMADEEYERFVELNRQVWQSQVRIGL